MKAADRIVGFGFSAGDVRPDFSDLEDTLSRIEETGASHCELNLPRYELVVDGRIVSERAARFRRICAARRLSYTAHGALAVNFMDEANLPLHKTVFRAMLDLAADVGAGLVVHHPGVVPTGTTDAIDRLHRIEREALEEFGNRAAAAGVRIGVETLFVEDQDRYTADPFRLADEIEAIGHPNVVGTLDLSHALIHAAVRGFDFEAAVRRFAEVAGHVHVHDSFGRPRLVRGHSVGEDIAYGMGDLHLPPGQGAIAWLELLPRLPLRSGTVLNVEMRHRHFSELPSVAAFMSRLVAACNAEPADAGVS